MFFFSGLFNQTGFRFKIQIKINLCSLIRSYVSFIQLTVILNLVFELSDEKQIEFTLRSFATVTYNNS